MWMGCLSPKRHVRSEPAKDQCARAKAGVLSARAQSGRDGVVDRLAKRRQAYAAEITRRAGVTDPKIEAAFAAIPREDFAGPPPWRIGSGAFGLTSADDP